MNPQEKLTPEACFLGVVLLFIRSRAKPARGRVQNHLREASGRLNWAQLRRQGRSEAVFGRLWGLLGRSWPLVGLS